MERSFSVLLKKEIVCMLPNLLQFFRPFFGLHFMAIDKKQFPYNNWCTLIYWGSQANP